MTWEPYNMMWLSVKLPIDIEINIMYTKCNISRSNHRTTCWQTAGESNNNGKTIVVTAPVLSRGNLQGAATPNRC